MADEKEQAAGTDKVDGDVLAPPKKPGKGLIIAIAGVLLAAGIGAGLFAGKMMGKGGEKSGIETTEQLALDAEKGAGQEAAPVPEPPDAKHDETKTEGGGHGNAAKPVKEAPASLFYEMIPIASNLNEASTRHAVRVQFWIEAYDAKALEEIKANEYRMRDALIILLGTKTLADLRTEEGKTLLKLEVMERIERVLGKGKVRDLGFRDLSFA